MLLVVCDVQGPKADGVAGLPSPLALSSEKLDPRGAYLLNDGLRFVLWLGKVLPAEFVKDLLGADAAHSADVTKVSPRDCKDSVVYLVVTLKAWMAFSSVCRVSRWNWDFLQGFTLMVVWLCV
jgi:hypothetical protein